MIKFKQALKYAVKRKFIGHNPANEVELPTKLEPRILQPSTSEIRLILQLADDMSEIIIAFAALGGLRRGEIFGLPRDCTFYTEYRGKQVLRLNISQQYYKRKIVNPKSKKSTRIVPMIPDLELSFKKWVLQCGSETWLFPGKFNKPFNPDQWTRDYLKPLLEKLNMPEYNLHSFRHFFTTMMLNFGVPIRDLGEIMGHKYKKMTLEYDKGEQDKLDHIVRITRNIKILDKKEFEIK